MRELTVLSTVFALWIAGCGGLAPDDESIAVLETFVGKVTNVQNVAVAGKVRVALVWFGDKAASQYNVSQDIPVEPKFPASFDLEIVSPPPADILIHKHDLEPSEQDGWADDTIAAFGTIVVYEDSNNNEQLDLLDLTDKQTIDTILAARKDLMVLYFAGTLPDGAPLPPQQSAEGQPKLGFNLFEFNFCPIRGLGEVAPPCQEKLKWYKAGEVFDLPMSLEPGLSDLICKTTPASEGGGSIQDMGTQQPSSYPGLGDFTCAPDGKSYLTIGCQTNLGTLCQGSVEICQHQRWHVPDPASPPVGWPCPNLVP